MKTMPKVLITPSKYVQGSGVIEDIGEFIAPLGNSLIVAGGERGLSETRAGREKSFEKNGVTQIEFEFCGDSTDREIGRLAAFITQNNCKVVMASGGGKVMDTVKAAAEDVGVASVIAPTVASNDAPCSALSVIYNEDGTFNRLRFLKRNPDLVIVDTSIISRAPMRFLVAGMGDALATWFEADACYKSGAKNFAGGAITATGITLARLCYDTLIEFGVEAKRACAEKTVNTALERIIEVNTLLSGVGFESGGTAVAHALSEGFTLIPEAHKSMHGETVAFSLLAQLMLRSEMENDADKVFDFCYRVGLPVTLSDIFVDKTDRDAIRSVAEAAAEPGRTTENMPFKVTSDMLIDAIYAADYAGCALKAAAAH